MSKLKEISSLIYLTFSSMRVWAVFDLLFDFQGFRGFQLFGGLAFGMFKHYYILELGFLSYYVISISDRKRVPLPVFTTTSPVKKFKISEKNSITMCFRTTN